MQAANQRDYDVINNRYLEYHEEKMQVNSDILKNEAAQQYWKTHNFDPVAVSYVDAEAEKDF